MAPNTSKSSKSTLQVDNIDDINPVVDAITDIHCQGYEDIQNETGKVRLFLLSGSSTSHLQDKIASFIKDVGDSPSLEEVSGVPQIKQNELYRVAILAESKERLLSTLESTIKNSKFVEVSPTKERKLAILPACQGNQYPQMGSKLYQLSPTFRNAFDYCASIIEQEFPDMKKFKHLVLDNEENEEENEQWPRDPQTFLPYTLALEYALYKFLTESWGISPQYLMGLSFGDYMGALVTGILSLKDTVNLIMTRCKLMTERIKEEAFIAVELNTEEYNKLEEEVMAELGIDDLEVDIACKNSPKQTCIVGKKEILQKLYDCCKSKGKRAMMNPTSLPYHSRLARPVLSDFEKVTSSVHYGNTEKVKFISTLDGEIRETMDKDYFLEHLTGPMNLIDAMLTLLKKERVTDFLEIGPHPIYQAWVKEILYDNRENEDLKDYFIMSSLNRKADERVSMLNTAGRLFLAGYELNWDNVRRELEN